MLGVTAKDQVSRGIVCFGVCLLSSAIGIFCDALPRGGVCRDVLSGRVNPHPAIRAGLRHCLRRVGWAGPWSFRALPRCSPALRSPVAGFWNPDCVAPGAETPIKTPSKTCYTPLKGRPVDKSGMSVKNATNCCPIASRNRIPVATPWLICIWIIGSRFTCVFLADR